MAFTNNWDASRLGQINQAGDVKALFLKKFAGEVITAFNTSSIMMDKQVVRTIESGKSAQFPVTGQVAAGYHTPGESLLESDNGYIQKVSHAEKLINIDDVLVSPVFIANIDEAMNHYDVRSIYTTEVGYALAKQMDLNLHQKLILAAREGETITGSNRAGTVIDSGATVVTDGNVLAAAMFDAAEALDNNEVPSEERFCIVRPSDYYNLVQATDTINRDWGGAGAYSEGKIFRVAGINIIKSIRLPSTVISTAAGDNNTYGGDFSNTVASVFHKSAIGTVKLLDLATESEYQIANQGTLIVSKYAMGHGILRPEASVEITKA